MRWFAVLSFFFMQATVTFSPWWLWWCTGRKSRNTKWSGRSRQLWQWCRKILRTSICRSSWWCRELCMIQARTGSERWWIRLHRFWRPWTVGGGWQPTPNKYSKSTKSPSHWNRGSRPEPKARRGPTKTQSWKCRGCDRRLPWIWSTSSSKFRWRMRGRRPSWLCCKLRWNWWTSPNTGSWRRWQTGSAIDQRFQRMISSSKSWAEGWWWPPSGTSPRTI